MSALLEQFLLESREFLQGIGEKLIELESEPDSADLMTELFRLVHTLKGNSGLFDYPEMTRVLHAGEDLLDAVRAGHGAFDQTMADDLLDAMDFVGALLDEVEHEGVISAEQVETSTALSERLRALMPASAIAARETSSQVVEQSCDLDLPNLEELPVEVLAAVEALRAEGKPLCMVGYRPEAECFFKGEDPFFQARQVGEVLWASVQARTPWKVGPEFDCYTCNLDFFMLVAEANATVQEHFRYVPEQTAIADWSVATSSDDARDTSEQALDAKQSTDQLVPLNVLQPEVASARAILAAQLTLLQGTKAGPTFTGRLKGVGATLAACAVALGWSDAPVKSALNSSLAAGNTAALEHYVHGCQMAIESELESAQEAEQVEETASSTCSSTERTDASGSRRSADIGVQPQRRASDGNAATVLKVEQSKVDRLMDLIGEMVVAKNALPYLAVRAEEAFGVRELSREIRAQYAVINRIAEEMQDAIMQVRMLPVSTIFQRFPRLVRDISRKLEKDVKLVLEGEETEADKNIVESLADPLIHIVRNSLDHGLETPEERLAAGKAATGLLKISAHPESDRVLIRIEDDGRGINADVIRRKAYEKGLIDEEQLERLSEQESVNLIFAPGFSTAETISDLSGRGVGMDVVRSAIERVGGTVNLDTVFGQGTTLTLSLPLSMAVTNVIIIESNQQIFGVPMDLVVETVRLARSDIQTLKHQKAAVLRGQLVPLRELNELLAVDAAPAVNEQDEVAVLVVRVGGEQVGLIVDDFREVVDVILKGLPGELSRLACYSGTALLGDGSVLMVLNPKELI